MSINSTPSTADIVADTEQAFAEALERLEDQLDQLASWAAEHDHADRGELLADAAGSVRTARGLDRH